ncbi:gastrula zinc finger protein XlCGF52.1-like [Diorhabda sublineata]|uniref:gastrula zinc finger protein XlCGF52.1-like n=1 Tax=Diorhabda sublineata TaxID=1163346 RepID=UPI0024E0443F|nr:gastrula zinc finger protein XlCGF52.1-like [Diorhabda sublineata]
MSKEDFSCCVCLNNNNCLTLNKLSKKDENQLTILSKLILNIPEIEWTIEHFICEACTNLLNIVHNFREMCLKSDFTRKQKNQKIEVNIHKQEIDKDSNSEIVKTENIQLDCKEDSDSVDISDNDVKNENSQNIEEKKCRRTRRNRKFEFDCEKCSKNFYSSIELIKHCVEIHRMIQKDVRPFCCTRCNSRFGNSSNLVQHIKYHDAVRSNVCSYCGKGFITKTDLKIHEKQHLNKREYECNICKKSFNTHKDLRSHKLVVHTDPLLWKYLCEYCNKRFPIKSNYDCHMRRHTGEKNFECHLCNRKFTDKCVLQRHMRTHSNIREFRCDQCDKEYKDKRVMQIHMAKIHGIGVGEIKLPSKEKKYICHICPKAYYAKNKLTRHLYTHTGEKPFFCAVCNKKFNDKSYVKQHMKKTHNIESDNSLYKL